MYDITIIGGGPAGYVAAIRAAQLGGRVALIERGDLGGTCLNRGCIPTKALVETSALLRKMRRANEYGIVNAGEPAVDLELVVRRKQEIVGRLVGAVVELLRGHRVDTIAGEGRLLAPGRVLVREAAGGLREIESRTVLVATGSEPADPGLEGTDLPGVVGSSELLEMRRLPASMVVIGASVVGMEFASIFHNLGTRVRVLGRRTFLKSVDQQLARRFRVLCTRRGMDIRTGVELHRIEQLDDGKLRVRCVCAGSELLADAEVVLIATGHAPLSRGLGLKELGVHLDRQGFVQADLGMHTNVPGVYAAGDVVAGTMLAHVASHEGIVAVENAMGGDRRVDYRAVPNCVFTDPEIATVGVTEAEAREMGIEVGMARFPLAANGRALTLGEEDGLARLIFERASGRVLGLHVMGPHASELAAEAALAVQTGVTVTEMAETMHQHPTLSEALMEAAMAAAHGEAIHYRRV